MYTYRDYITATEIEFGTLSATKSDRAYNVLSKIDDPTFIEQTFNLITNNKYNINELEAGIVINVIYSCLKLSGVFKNIKEIPDKIDEARAKVKENILYMFYKTIVKAQPFYTLDILKEKSVNELLDIMAFSDDILGHDSIDTAKMRKLINEPTVDGKVIPKKKGVNNVSPEEIDFIKNMIGNEELQQGPFV